jgi:predicted amidophosphoribosyltransferase
VYDEGARALVSSWKEKGRRGLAGEAAVLVTEVVAAPAVDVLTHVPGDPERALERGDVPPRALAEALGALWSIPAEGLLRRTRTLERQRGLSLRERRRNVRGTVAAELEAPRRVCLIDDVYTSGATADACASALRKAGARHVEVVTFARAVR